MTIAYRDGRLGMDGVPLADLARRFGTPCYVYSGDAIAAAYGEYQRALAGRDALVCYSVKANSNLAVLALMARLGAGFDIVSGGELERVLAAGGDPGRVVFSGVGKTEEEISRAINVGIRCLNVESEAELEHVSRIAQRTGKRAPVAFRVNPDIDAQTHPYISTGLRDNKFGVGHDDALRLYRRAAGLPGIRVLGIGCHIGSQLLDRAPYVAAVRRLVALADEIENSGIGLSHYDLGGGIGIRYGEEEPHSIGEFISGALEAIGDRRKTVIVDPGRSIVGSAGVLLTQVEYVKDSGSKRFLVTDVAMNDLLRPALYDAWHDVLPLDAPRPDDTPAEYDIVGPVCESADFIARSRTMAARAGSFLAVCGAGAYGMSMSSNYNSRPRAAEVLVYRGSIHLVRRRERTEELFASESIPVW